MQIKYGAQETIYPALSSQPHTGLRKLSELDQVMSQRPMAITQLFFFRKGPSEANMRALKRSLSEVLAIFYPLAGRLVEREGEGGRQDVSCCDQGAGFCVAWADGRLDAFDPDFQPHPDLRLLAPDSTHHPEALLRVQVTHFQCGGMCLCVQIHHTLCDGASCAHFMESWAELASGKGSLTLHPYMENSLLEDIYKIKEPSFPQHQTNMVNLPSNNLPTRSKIFHFTPICIQTLKKKANHTSPHTSFECLVSHIWQQVVRARGLPSSQEVRLGFPVDGRKRFNPPLPLGYFGNVVFQACAITTAGELVEKPLSYVADLVKEAIARISNDYMLCELEWLGKQSPPTSPMFGSSSSDLLLNTWARFPLCDLDFEWGRPSCVRIPVPSQVDGRVLMLPSSIGKGHIDALLTLHNEHLHKLESLIVVS